MSYTSNQLVPYFLFSMLKNKKRKSQNWIAWRPLFRLSGYFHPRKGELLLDDIAFRHSRRGDDDDEDDGDHNDNKDGDED